MKKTIIIMMSILTISCSRSIDNEKKIIGNWQCDLKDETTGKKIGTIILEFTKDGKFIYKEHEKTFESSYQQLYHAEANEIYLRGIDTKDYPVSYYFENEKLIIELDGIKNTYEKTK
ncbi:hypothetical protein [Flavobacterium sp. LHD-85]|uniref:hypothetical protein n=1 Tax=Flavobacterium sp. LHD-85 TaxID=3071410 RepID=UPI0027DF40A2|nr:hypothetical protein [Flavobacterium sp. LHD-85]MDQ6528504.1 hypothetical protein [Flavobacterium sp. LHD-85]